MTHMAIIISFSPDCGENVKPNIVKTLYPILLMPPFPA